MKTLNFCLLFFYFFITSCTSDYSVKSTPTPSNSYNEIKTNKLDVLFLLDTSCSMNDDHTAMQTGISFAVRDIVNSDYNAKIALTNMTVEPEYQTAFIDVSNSNDPEWDMTFAVQDLHDLHAGGEFGFATALYHLQTNAWFFRNDSLKLFVFMSDEVEQSDTDSQTFLLSLPEPYYVISIVNNHNPADVGYENTYVCGAEYALKYINASHRTISICEEEPWYILDNNGQVY